MFDDWQPAAKLEKVPNYLRPKMRWIVVRYDNPDQFVAAVTWDGAKEKWVDYQGTGHSGFVEFKVIH